MELSRSFTAEQYARALESWDWAGIDGKEPVFASPFGDVFLRADDGYWYLDVLDGKLSRPWLSGSELEAELNTPEGQDRYLLAGLALAAEQHGVVATDDKVLGFKVPPALGGPTAVDNIEATDFVVSVNLAGQLHAQIRDLPAGTPISRVVLAPENPATKKRRFRRPRGDFSTFCW